VSAGEGNDHVSLGRSGLGSRQRYLFLQSGGGVTAGGGAVVMDSISAAAGFFGGGGSDTHLWGADNHIVARRQCRATWPRRLGYDIDRGQVGDTVFGGDGADSIVVGDSNAEVFGGGGST